MLDWGISKDEDMLDWGISKDEDMLDWGIGKDEDMLDWEIALLPIKIKTQMWENKDPIETHY